MVVLVADDSDHQEAPGTEKLCIGHLDCAILNHGIMYMADIVLVSVDLKAVESWRVEMNAWR